MFQKHLQKTFCQSLTYCIYYIFKESNKNARQPSDSLAAILKSEKIWCGPDENVPNRIFSRIEEEHLKKRDKRAPGITSFAFSTPSLLQTEQLPPCPLPKL